MRPHLRALRRAGSAVTGGTLVAAALTVAAPAPQAHAEADPTPAAIGADWLERHIVDGVVRSSYVDVGTGEPVEYDDLGGTIEAAYALDAVGSTGEIAAISAALEEVAGSYTGDAYGEVYAGSTGKLLSYVTDFVDGADVHAFGGVDLLGNLEARTAGEGVTAGRISDDSSWGDFSNSFGQAWATRALLNAGSAEAPDALGFLFKQQCAAGFFRLYFASADAPDQTCDGADPAEPVPAVDTTAVVVVLLHEFAAANPALATAIDRAVAWMKTQQAANGSFSGGTATEGANANSTGLAGRALQLVGETAAATKAATWIRRHQVPGTRCDRSASGQTGAIAYDDAAYRDGLADGVNLRNQGTWITSVIQALPGLLAAPAAASPFGLGSVPEFLDGGGTARVRVSGLAPGQRGCVRIGRKAAAVVGDADGSVVAKVGVPNRTGFVATTAETADREVGTELVALAAKELPFDRKREVRRGGTQKVVVRGLFAGEKVRVLYDGERVDAGRARTDGTFVARFPVGRTRGEHKVKIVGHFADRTDVKAFRVVG